MQATQEDMSMKSSDMCYYTVIDLTYTKETQIKASMKRLLPVTVSAHQ